MSKRDYRVRVYRWVEQPPVRWCECVEATDNQVDASGELVLPVDPASIPNKTHPSQSGEHPGIIGPSNFRGWLALQESAGELKEDTNPSMPSLATLTRLSHSTSYASISHIRSHYLSESSDTMELVVSELDKEEIEN